MVLRDLVLGGCCFTRQTDSDPSKPFFVLQQLNQQETELHQLAQLLRSSINGAEHRIIKHVAKEPFKGRAQDHQTFFLWERTSLEPKWPDVRSGFPAASLSNQPVEPAP